MLRSLSQGSKAKPFLCLFEHELEANNFCATGTERKII
jgi:hypothetical protein